MKTTTPLLLFLSILAFPGLLSAQNSSPQTAPSPGVSTSVSVSVETLPDGTASSATVFSEKKSRNESKSACTILPDKMRATWLAEAETRKDAEILAPNDTTQTLSRLNKTVVAKGTIQGATSVIRGDLFLLGTAQGPISVVGGNATILGKVFGPVSVVGGDLRVAGEITGDAAVVGGSIVKAPGAVISGHTSTVGGFWNSSFCKKSKWCNNANINMNLGSLCKPHHCAAWNAIILALKLTAGALWLATAALLAYLIPAPLEKALGHLRNDALKSVGIGLLFWIVFGFMVGISLVLCLLLIGVPMIGLLVLLALTMKGFGITVVFLWTGRMLCARFQRETTSTVSPVVIGGLVLVLLRLIPCLGSILWLAIIIVSAGISILAFIRRSQSGTTGV